MPNAYTNLLLHNQQLKKLYYLQLDPVCTAYGLTKNEVDVLLFLANNAPYDTAKDIVELRGLSKSQVCKSVDLLTARGFLSACHDEKDRRCIHLSLTSAAKPAVSAAQTAQANCLSLLYQNITPAEKNMMDGVFAKIHQNLQEALSHAI